MPTAYAISRGVRTNRYGTKDGVPVPTCYWWLRSPGTYQFEAAIVDYVGSVSYCGNHVIIDYNCVRPAMWLSLE